MILISSEHVPSRVQETTGMKGVLEVPIEDYMRETFKIVSGVCAATTSFRCQEGTFTWKLLEGLGPETMGPA